MSEQKPFDRDSISNTLFVAIGLSLICSIVVASTAISLKPVQKKNEEEFRQRIILEVAGLMEPDKSIDELFKAIEPRMVDLETGEYTEDLDPTTFNALMAAGDPQLGIAIPQDLDIAGIRRRARYAPVYLVGEGDDVEQIILPVYGKGLWSTMLGYLSLASDGKTVKGLRFYSHAETPGLGDQIDRDEWRAQWPGKLIFAEGDQPKIEVIRGKVDQSLPSAVYQVDGLSGATLTGRGVTHLVQYWTGPHGFGPYLNSHRSAEDNSQ